MLKPNEDCNRFHFSQKSQKSWGLSLQCHPLTISLHVPFLHFIQPQGRMDILCHYVVNNSDLIHQISSDHCYITNSNNWLSTLRQEAIGTAVPNMTISRDVRANHGSNEADRSEKKKKRSFFFPAGLQACFINQLPGE